MNRLLTSILILGCSLPLAGQVRTLDLGQRKVDISVLPQKGQEQFEADYKLIMADEQLKSTYAAMVREKMRGFSGTEQERTTFLAKLAHSVVENTPPSGTVTTATISPEIATQFTELRQPVSRKVRVSSDVLMKKAEDMEVVRPSQQPDKGTDPRPSAPSSANVFQGEIAYAIPDTMEIGKVYKVKLVVGVDPEVARQLADRQDGDTRSDQIGIGRYMKAELKDFYAFGDEEGAFDIELWIGQPIQVIDPDDQDASISWEWKVRAETPGNQMLGVKVSIIVFDERLPDGRAYQSIDTYEKPIHIVAMPGNQANFSPDSPAEKPSGSNSGNDNLLMVLGMVGGAFLLGILFYFVSRSRQRNKYKQETEAAEGPSIPEVAAGDGKADPEEIKALIKAGEFEAAAGELKDLAILTNYDDRASIIAIQARIQHWQTDIHNNVIDGESARQERSRITLAMLHLLESIQEAQA